MLDKLEEMRIVPMIAVDSVDDALRLGEALIAGGLPVAEITFRTPVAADAMRALCQEFPDMIVGAGTVLTTDDVKRAVAAGAKFAVAPGCNPAVVRTAAEAGLPFAPGVCTPTDVESALSLGARFLKFFPAEAAGGVTMLKALSGPYGHLGIGFCPTGGVGLHNLRDYLALPLVAMVGGSWIASKTALRDGDWDGITSRAREARAVVESMVA